MTHTCASARMDTSRSCCMLNTIIWTVIIAKRLVLRRQPPHRHPVLPQLQHPRPRPRLRPLQLLRRHRQLLQARPRPRLPPCPPPHPPPLLPYTIATQALTNAG
jgi:hypothetical protein